jgi:type I restriction enzyme S subunit
MKYQTYPNYKPSGVEWLGDVPEHWKLCRLKFMAKIKNGQDYKAVEVEDGYPVIGSGGQFSYASEFTYDKESVLLGRKGTIDKPLYIDEPFWTVDTMYYTEINKNIYPKYLYYLALTIQFGRYSTSTALPSMTQEHLGNFIFAIPDYELDNKKSPTS